MFFLLLLLLLPISSHFEATVQKFIKLCKNSLRRKMTECGQTDHGHVCSMPSELCPFFLCSSFSGGWGTASRSTFSSLYTQSTWCCRWCVGILAQALIGAGRYHRSLKTVYSSGSTLGTGWRNTQSSSSLSPWDSYLAISDGMSKDVANVLILWCCRVMIIYQGPMSMLYFSGDSI